MCRRIAPGDPISDNGHGSPARVKCSPVGCAVDTLREAGQHGNALSGQLPRYRLSNRSARVGGFT